MARLIFVNLAVRDIQATTTFFGKLGFEFNKRFTDANNACMIINETASVMLLSTAFFQGFTKKKICDTSTQSEALLAVSVDSRPEVDTFVDKALALGGTPALPPQDHGFMYVRTFYDLDGHHWEVAWMDPAAFQA